MEFISLAIKKQKHMGLQKKECSNTPIHPLMTSSDFLVLITILLAIVSTAIANNKMIWIYKFSRFSIITYILIMIAINYFIFFPWYEQRGIYIERLMIKGSPLAAISFPSLTKNDGISLSNIVPSSRPIVSFPCTSFPPR